MVWLSLWLAHDLFNLLSGQYLLLDIHDGLKLLFYLLIFLFDLLEHLVVSLLVGSGIIQTWLVQWLSIFDAGVLGLVVSDVNLKLWEGGYCRDLERRVHLVILVVACIFDLNELSLFEA